MNLSQAKNTGKKFGREGWNRFVSFEEYEQMNLKYDDFIATDYVVEPDRPISFATEADLIRVWNAALPSDTAEGNKAPNSQRFKRFLEIARG